MVIGDLPWGWCSRCIAERRPASGLRPGVEPGESGWLQPALRDTSRASAGTPGSGGGAADLLVELDGAEYRLHGGGVPAGPALRRGDGVGGEAGGDGGHGGSGPALGHDPFPHGGGEGDGPAEAYALGPLDGEGVLGALAD